MTESFSVSYVNIATIHNTELIDMPNLDLDSLLRLLAVEEAALAYPALATAAGSSSSSGVDHVPVMESLRSPTTKALLSIVQHRSSTGWMRFQLDAAEKERDELEDVARDADSLLKAPLMASFKEQIAPLVQHSVEVGRGAHAEGSCHDHGALAVNEEGTACFDEKGRRCVGAVEQPSGRRSYVYAASGGFDDDTTLVAGIQMTHPREELEAIFPSTGSNKPALVPLKSSSALNSSGGVHRTTSDHLTADNLDDALALIPQQAKVECHTQATSTPGNSIDSRNKLKALLHEQATAHKELSASKASYLQLMAGLEKWQHTRLQAADKVLSTPVPYTTV